MQAKEAPVMDLSQHPDGLIHIEPAKPRRPAGQSSAQTMRPSTTARARADRREAAGNWQTAVVGSLAPTTVATSSAEDMEEDEAGGTSAPSSGATVPQEQSALQNLIAQAVGSAMGQVTAQMVNLEQQVQFLMQREGMVVNAVSELTKAAEENASLLSLPHKRR